MTYKEFCDEIVASILELTEEYSKLSKEEFEDYRKEVMQEVEQRKLSIDFMTAVFDMIYRNVFQAA